MHSGLLNRRITIQKLTIIQDDGGGYTEDWQDEVTVWASVQPLNGIERYAAMQLGYEADFKVIIRYNDNLVSPNKKLRIKTAANYLLPWYPAEDPNETVYVDILDVKDPLLKGKHLELLCRFERPDK